MPFANRVVRLYNRANETLLLLVARYRLQREIMAYQLLSLSRTAPHLIAVT